MKRDKILTYFILTICLLPLIVTGCGESGDFSWSMANQPLSEQEESGEPVEDTLSLSMPQESGEWNPYTNTSRTMQGLMRLCFESLVTLDDFLKPSPCLAEGWEIEKDGEGTTKYTFTLRKGVYFHDGSGLTAKDVVRVMDEILTRGSEGPWYSALEGLDSWIAEDERTLVVRALDGGYSLLYKMTFPIAHIVGEGAISGTGAYILDEYSAGERLLLTAQTRWWKQAPSITSVEARAYWDNEAELAGKAYGELDFVSTRIMTASLYKMAGVTEAQDYLTQTFELLTFNFDRPIMADNTIRTAISMAIERKEIISSVYQNHAVSCDMPIPPDHWLYEPRMEERQVNAQAARKLLSDAGFVDYTDDGLFDDPPLPLRHHMENIAAALEGEEDEENDEYTSAAQNNYMKFILLTTYDRESPMRRDAALRIAEQLGNIGLSVQVREVDMDDLSEQIEEGDYDMLLIGYQMPLSGDLNFLLDSGNEGEESGARIMRKTDSVMDELLTRAAQALTDAEYREALVEIQRRLYTELPFIGLYFRNGTILFDANLVMTGAVRENDPYRNLERWQFAP